MSDSFKVELLLKSPECVAIQEDLLNPESSWGRVLSSESLRNLIFEKPSLFKNSPIKKIYEFSGCSSSFSSVLNDRYSLQTKPIEDGIELQTFNSLDEFGKSSGIGWLQTLVGEIQKQPQVYN